MVPASEELVDPGLLRRARMHAALGEPVRLAMVRRLLLTDASPGELGAAYGLATNALAHHLRVLQDAAVVRRVRSEGDARRAYLQLRLDDPELAGIVAASARPELGAAARPVPGRRSPGRTRPDRVLFVCTANSARSQLAAAAWRSVSRLPAACAGTHPAARIHPRALAVGRRHALPLDRARTAHLADVIHPGDLLVCVCDRAHEELSDPPAGASAGRVHWAVPDPVRVDTDAAFEDACTEILARVRRLAAALTSAARADPEPPLGERQA